MEERNQYLKQINEQEIVQDSYPSEPQLINVEIVKQESQPKPGKKSRKTSRKNGHHPQAFSFKDKEEETNAIQVLNQQPVDAQTPMTASTAGRQVTGQELKLAYQDQVSYDVLSSQIRHSD